MSSFSSPLFPSLPPHPPASLWTFAMLSFTRRRQTEFTHPLIVSIPSIMFHPLIRGTSPYSLISRSPTLSLLIPLYLSQFLHLSLSLGISFLSAFYSKSNRKAFIQPNLRDSGYIWFAWCREMLYQGKGWRARQSDRKREGNIVLIWYWLITKW